MTTALVIEDNENNMVLITKLLQNAGYKVLQAEAGRKGFNLTVSGQPDFVLLDIQLPDIDGREVLTMIRATLGVSKIPVIAVTSYVMSGDRERLMAAGCNGYIEKPIDPDGVIAEIENILNEAGVPKVSTE